MNVLELHNLTKLFAGNAALDGVSLQIGSGEVHGLLGHNGSGKSTLIKVLAGYHVPEAGSVLKVRGEEEPLPLDPARAHALGLAFVHQDLALVPTLSVLENLRVPQWGKRRGHIRWRLEREQAAADLAALDLDVDLDRQIGGLNKGERALVAIARAVAAMGLTRDGHHEAGVLVLDEPTVFLSRSGRDRLFQLVRRIADLGAGVLFVSHDLDEVIEHTDSVTVLRDGRVVGHQPTRETTRAELVHWIVGRHIEATGPSEAAIGREALATVEMTAGGRTPLSDISFDLRKGEILGATGLLGSGFDELPYLLFGAGEVSGRMSLDGLDIDMGLLDPAGAIAFGIGLIPSNRQRDGGIMTLPVAENVMMLALREVSRRGWLSSRRLVATARTEMTLFDVRPNEPLLGYGRLSGGNQQKALIAKWLHAKPKVLLIDEPTQGVDVGARRQIVDQLRRMCADGGAVLYCSSDHAELAEVCDRVLILRRGRLAGVLEGAALTKERITQECIGTDLGKGVPA